MAEIETREEHLCFDGRMGYYSHRSVATGTMMNFAVYVPPQALNGERKVPAVYFLAGLTCTEETFMIKAGAQRVAAELGLILVTSDTSPRGLDLPNEHLDWDLGSGAGFYLEATAEPWAPHYRMGPYVNEELPGLIEAHFPATPDVRGIMGHSMGGHGALITALRNPERWQSVSAFAPICNPVAVPWGEKAFGAYLGADRESWAAWDASLQMSASPIDTEILVDQGLDDAFLASQLHPQALLEAAQTSGQRLKLRQQVGYDHSYWFIQSFIQDHLRHHAAVLL